jgi:hypothetical protein
MTIQYQVKLVFFPKNDHLFAPHSDLKSKSGLNWRLKRKYWEKKHMILLKIELVCVCVLTVRHVDCQSSVERRVVGQPVTHASTWLPQTPSQPGFTRIIQLTEVTLSRIANLIYTKPANSPTTTRHRSTCKSSHSTHFGIEATDQPCCRQVTNYLAHFENITSLHFNTLPQGTSLRQVANHLAQEHNLSTFGRVRNTWLTTRWWHIPESSSCCKETHLQVKWSAFCGLIEVKTELLE